MLTSVSIHNRSVFMEGLSCMNPLRLIKALHCDKNSSQRDVSCSFWQAFGMLLHHIWETMWPHLLTWQDLSLTRVRVRPPGNDFCSLSWPCLHITWSRLMVNRPVWAGPHWSFLKASLEQRGSYCYMLPARLLWREEEREVTAWFGRLKEHINGYNLGVFHQHIEISAESCYVSFPCYRKCIG